MFEVTVSSIPTPKPGVIITPGLHGESLQKSVEDQFPKISCYMVPCKEKSSWMAEQLKLKNPGFENYPIFSGENLLNQMKEAKVKPNQWFGIITFSANEEENILVGEAKVKDLGYLWSDLEYSFELREVYHFALFQNAKSERKTTKNVF